MKYEPMTLKHFWNYIFSTLSNVQIRNFTGRVLAHACFTGVSYVVKSLVPVLSSHAHTHTRPSFSEPGLFCSSNQTRWFVVRQAGTQNSRLLFLNENPIPPLE